MLVRRAARYGWLAAAGLTAAVSGLAQAIPASTAIPIVLTRTVEAGQAKAGDVVTAQTMQAVFLPGGQVLPAGVTLTGHVVASTPLVYDATPYAVQKPSVLSVHFDNIAEGGTVVPVTLAVRAIAGPVTSHEAEIPHEMDELDWSGTRILVGGESTSALEKTVLAADGSVVGYNRKQGVFARLLAAERLNRGAEVRCGATETEQSVGIFSADACGVYGLNTVALMESGTGEGGTFVLASRERPVELYAGSTALLEVMAR